MRIVLPALEKLDEEDLVERRPRLEPSKTGSGLFALLPEPKQSNFTRKLPSAALAQSSNAPVISSNPNENNLKPQGVRKVGLVPHRVANPVKVVPKKDNSDDSDDDGDYLNVQSSYFAAGSSEKSVGVGVSSRMTINPVPSQVEDDHHLLHQPQPEILGPAVAPYPPPAPYQDQKQRKYFSSHLKWIFYVYDPQGSLWRARKLS